jgi:LPXTG-site transpeptidase (sortase) family protein
MRSPNASGPRPARRIHPLAAAGGVLILVSATALIAYALLTLPQKQAAARGVPEDFRVAAQQQATSVAFEGQSPQAVASPAPTNASVEAQSAEGPTPTLLVAVPSDYHTPTPIPASGGGVTTEGDPVARAQELGLPEWATVDYWLSIPRLEMEAPVMALDPRSHNEDGQAIRRMPVPDAYLVGYDAESAEPGFGGNTIMTGHNNLWGAVFKYLDELEVGDEIAVWSQYGVFTYHVSEVAILPEADQPYEIRLANARYLQPTAEDRLTLVTCWPRNGSSHRLIIVATR